MNRRSFFSQLFPLVGLCVCPTLFLINGRSSATVMPKGCPFTADQFVDWIQHGYDRKTFLRHWDWFDAHPDAAEQLVPASICRRLNTKYGATWEKMFVFLSVFGRHKLMN